MRVLQVNKFLWESAGPERYMLEVSELLRAGGHEVLFFAMQHQRNLPSPHSRYFVSQINYRNTSAWYKLKTALRTAGKALSVSGEKATSRTLPCTSAAATTYLSEKRASAAVRGVSLPATSSAAL